eukprot:scaffold3524_cov279-Chaetoceros_neogracile.AAC.9
MPRPKLRTHPLVLLGMALFESFPWGLTSRYQSIILIHAFVYVTINLFARHSLRGRGIIVR